MEGVIGRGTKRGEEKIIQKRRDKKRWKEDEERTTVGVLKSSMGFTMRPGHGRRDSVFY